MAPRVVAMRESPNTSTWSPLGIDQSWAGAPGGTVGVAVGVGAGAAAGVAALSAISCSVSLRAGAVTTTARLAARSRTAPATAARGPQDEPDRTAPHAIRVHSPNPHTRIGASTNR